MKFKTWLENRLSEENKELSAMVSGLVQKAIPAAELEGDVKPDKIADLVQKALPKNLLTVNRAGIQQLITQQQAAKAKQPKPMTAVTAPKMI